MSALATEPNAALIEELRKQIEALSARLEKLEQQPAAAAPVSTPAPPAAAAVGQSQPQVEEISAETLLVISAAVAAFLGERGHIRAVRLVGSARWAQEGRVSIQASHRLNRT
ncbi:MAG: hypothetical protein SGI92_02570 [Bryobacteraceae bacterium]|nr:hypothetical protein [Bryobacteraceae bacterium]